MGFELFKCTSTTRALPAACQWCVRLGGIQCKLELTVRFKVPGSWGCAGTACTEYQQRIFRLRKRQARVGGLVTIWIPHDALRAPVNDAVRGAHRICVAVFTGGGYSYGGGCVCEVAEVPAKGDIFTLSNLVKRGGLGGRLGENDLSRVPVSTDGSDRCRACIVPRATRYTDE